MKSLIKIFCSLICMYVVMSKIYAISYYFINFKIDIPVLIFDMIILYACVFYFFFLWRKKNIKHKTLWIILIIVSIFAQLFIGLFNFLTKNPIENQKKIFWIIDVPNLLSIFILLALLISINGDKKQYNHKETLRH